MHGEDAASLNSSLVVMRCHSIRSPVSRKISTCSCVRVVGFYVVALARFGLPLSNIREEDLAEPRKFFRFGREPVAIDILPGIDGVNFDAAWEKRVESVIDPQSALTAFFISRDDLICIEADGGPDARSC